MTDSPLQVFTPSDPGIQKLISSILSEIYQRYGLDLSGDPAALQRIRAGAEQAYRELRVNPHAEIDLPYISANSAGPIHFKRLVTRGEIGLSPDSSADRPSSRAGDEQRVQPEKVRLQLPERKPVVTIALMSLMTVIYLLQLLTGYLYHQDLPAALGMKINEAIIDGQYWRLITAMFLHGGILHLGFNLYALYILGRTVENFFGHWRFLGLFLLSGISGNLCSFLLTASPSLGSSTAIFGLLAAEGVFIYQHKQLYGERFGKALWQITQVAVINFIIGLSPGIDNWGHFGGLLGGIAFTWFGGPEFTLQGAPPVVRLQDRRPERRSGVVFIVELILLIGLAAWAIISRR